MGSYTIETLTGWVSDSASRVESVGSQLTQDRAEVQKNREQVVELQKQLARQEYAAYTLRSQISSLKSAARKQENNEEDASGLHSQIGQLQAQLAQVESAIGAVKGQVSQAEAAIRQIQQQIGVHLEKLHRMDGAMGDIHNQLEEKYNERAAAKAKFSQVSGIRFGSSGSGAAAQMQGAMNTCRSAQNQAAAVRNRISQLLGEDGTHTEGRDPTLSADELRTIRMMEESGQMEDDHLSLNRSYSHMGHSVLTEKPLEVDFGYSSTATYSEGAFIDEALEQEMNLNNMTVADFIRNFETRKDQGRSKDGNKAQKQYAEGVRVDIMEELRTLDSSLTEQQRWGIAKERMRGGAALHAVDQVAGGSPTEIYSYGSGAANSAMGSLWGHERAEKLYNQVMELCKTKKMTPEQKSSTYLNVRFNIHPKKK